MMTEQADHGLPQETVRELEQESAERRDRRADTEDRDDDHGMD